MKVLDSIIRCNESKECLDILIKGWRCRLKQKDYTYVLVGPSRTIELTHGLLKQREKLDVEALRYIIRASVIDLITIGLKNELADDVEYKLCDSDVDAIEDFVEHESNKMLHVQNPTNDLAIEDVTLFTRKELVVAVDAGNLIALNKKDGKVKLNMLPSYLLVYLEGRQFPAQLEYLITVLETYRMRGLNIRKHLK